MSYSDVFRKVTIIVNDICSGIGGCRESLVNNHFFQLFVEENESVPEEHFDLEEESIEPVVCPTKLPKWEPTLKKCAAKRKRHMARKKANAVAEMREFLGIVHEHEVTLAELLLEHLQQFKKPQGDVSSSREILKDKLTLDQGMWLIASKVTLTREPLLTPAGGVGRKRRSQSISPEETAAVSPGTTARRLSARLQGQPPSPQNIIRARC